MGWVLGLEFDYLPVVLEVGFEDVFDVCRVDCVNLGAARTKDSEGFLGARKVCIVVVQPIEVYDQMDEGACKWVILAICSMEEELEEEGSENKGSSYAYDCRRKGTAKEIHGI